ncbi:sel1 repeat family protein [Variovorax guangxiensis]|jgi:TPR repeat protein|uniref:Sel1 repeat family protein n=1 Tax=Variovorax guangxiensis TaxID=1775474 RepID=A0A3S0XH82_9BURK|nr:sel1 repeat family protein [Variovorax guangxiensis]RUR69318.1 sel1 repeat family protein [Variovorax guangxiensis]
MPTEQLDLGRMTGLSLRLRVVLSGALMLAAAISAARPSGADIDLQAEQRFQLALEAQAARDYRAMLQHLRDAATDGHAEAQEMLGMVLMTGPALYGTAVKADRCEAGEWMRRAAVQGSETAKVQLTFLNRLRSSPDGRRACG